ncbi:hypothetical protein EV175_001746 [Coemansia sp. RSA 1933]|nr:hypothetical protein EV175_001746 [Coemansia sp. RSA 1933]
MVVGLSKKGHSRTASSSASPSASSIWKFPIRSLLQLADGKIHNCQMLPAFTESTDSLSDENFTGQLDGSPQLSNRKYSDERTLKNKMKEYESLGEHSARTNVARQSSINDTNDIIALYSCKCGSSASICRSQLDDGPVEPKRESLQLDHSNSPFKMDLVAIQKLSDKHLFDVASVPLPETPSTINSTRITQSTNEASSFGSALPGGQRERTSSDPATATLQSPYHLDGTRRQSHSTSAASDSRHAFYSDNSRQQNQDLGPEQGRHVDDLLREAEARHQKDIEALKQGFQRQLSKQSQESQAHIERYKAKVSELTTERDEMQFMLEEYIATSGRLIEQKESEADVLTRELGKATLERQQVQAKLDECESRADALSSERKEAYERVESLVAENVRLEDLSNDLRNDVLVAEERNGLIKKHAQATLDKANAEITKLHGLLTQTKSDVSSLQTQTSKVDARAKSLQIQLNSTKQQNKDLLELCERLESSLV